MSGCRNIVLASRPKGAPTFSNFRLEEGPIPVAKKGQVLVPTRYLSLDPYMRGRMNVAAPHSTEIRAGMDGEVVAEIAESMHPAYRPGEMVLAMAGWCTHAAVDASCLRRVDPRQTPVTTALGVLGMPGFAAYTGTKLIGQPTEGETAVVAAACGPVGSLLGQLARLAGARAVGIAGGAEKCAYVRDELGFDAVVDRRAGDFRRRWREPVRTGWESCWFVSGEVRRAHYRTGDPLLLSARGSPCCRERGNTLLGVLVVDVLKSGIYDLWAAVEAP